MSENAYYSDSLFVNRAGKWCAGVAHENIDNSEVIEVVCLDPTSTHTLSLSADDLIAMLAMLNLTSGGRSDIEELLRMYSS